jgi:hypothetical protein
MRGTGARATSLLLTLCLGSAFGVATPEEQKTDTAAQPLPEEIRGVKVYRLPDKMERRLQEDNPVIYRALSYDDINTERLVLKLALSVKPVDRPATVRKIYFQDIRLNNIPVHIEPFEEEFKLSKKDVVDLPAPLQCTVVFSDLDSLAPLQEIVNKDEVRITGQTFLDVKLNPLEKLAVRAQRVVVPVQVSEKVPLQMFSGNPLLKMAATTILDTLADPASAAAVALAKEHLAKLERDRAVASLGQGSIFLLYCEFALRDPQTGVTEKFAQSGTGFVVSPEGKLLTSKRVVYPWKFDPQAAFLMAKHALELDKTSYRLIAWPSEAMPLSAAGEPDLTAAFAQEKETLKLLKTPPDSMESVSFEDPDSGEKATLTLHATGENDLALLEIQGGNFQPLPWAEAGAASDGDRKTALLGFPFGLSQPRAIAKTDWVQVVPEGGSLKLGRRLNAGESGAPLVTAEGKVVAVCPGPETCVPIEVARALMQ